MSKHEAKEIETKEQDNKECFVIMPIGNKEGYPKGHFKRVYEDIFKIAIEEAGFKPCRADDNNTSHLIQLEIIKKIIEAPMAICDLSMRNPNVLFELGIRQAFDKPVVLVQEVGTERIFDINSINTYDYRKERIYNEVLEDRIEICNRIKETFEKHDAGQCVNSLLKLINIEPAKNESMNVGSDEMMKVIFNEVMGIKMKLNEQLSYHRNVYSTIYEDNNNELDMRALVKKSSVLNEEYIHLIKIKNQMPEQRYIRRLRVLDRELLDIIQRVGLENENIPIIKEIRKLHFKIDFELGNFMKNEV